jgi:hypothetical protein
LDWPVLASGRLQTARRTPDGESNLSGVEAPHGDNNDYGEMMIDPASLSCPQRPLYILREQVDGELENVM